MKKSGKLQKGKTPENKTRGHETESMFALNYYVLEQQAKVQNEIQFANLKFFGTNSMATISPADFAFSDGR